MPHLEFVGAAILDAEYVNTSGMVAPSMSGNRKHICPLNWTLCVRVFCGLALSLKNQITLSTVVATMQQKVIYGKKKKRRYISVFATFTYNYVFPIQWKVVPN